MLARSHCLLLAVCFLSSTAQADPIRELQQQAIEQKHSDFGHWGWQPENYMLWGTHSNRLIPVYTFGTRNAEDGISLKSLRESSPYRDADQLKELFDTVPNATLNSEAPYFDQTNIFDLQKAALDAGRKHIILIVFDGMDWQTTKAASIYRSQKVGKMAGRGHGLHMQDYRAGGTSEYGWMVTSPYLDDAKVDVNTQEVVSVDKSLRGGYAFETAGPFPWSTPTDLQYLIGKAENPELRQAYTDSASSATSMTSGTKTYNASINVDVHGKQADTIAHLAQKKGYRVGVVTSVPISHATPASAYGHNVHRNDYQDLSRDLLGLPSVSHPEKPLPGVDLLIGAGYGAERSQDKGQGKNFVPGNAYLTAEDLQKIDARNGGRYVVAMRESGVIGKELLKTRVQDAIDQNKRFFGFYGVDSGHLPFQTADGKYDPTLGRRKKAESYSEADLKENPVLADFASAALAYLGTESPFWLMVEAGDVDWANHDNNIDNSIGAVLSGDRAVKTVTDWVEANSSWDETVLIVTADHGHYLVIEKPEMLIVKDAESAE